MRRYVLVAVIAIVFGSSAGWLGANFDKDWFTSDEPVRQQRFSPEFRDQMRQEQELNDRLRCIEDKIAGFRPYISC